MVPSRSSFQLTDGVVDVGGATPVSEGKPRKVTATGPDSTMLAARLSSRWGTTS